MALETPDSLDNDLKPMVLQIVAQNASLLGRIDELLGQISKLNARIAELEGKSGQPPKTPDNSSLPPSSAHKANVSAQDGNPRAKGRKGRVGVARTLAENPDATREFYADQCACGHALSQADQPDRVAYDHIDLPPIKPVTTRIHLHKGRCPCCQKRVTATPPADMMPGTPFGPGIVALVTYLHACQMVSYSRMTELLGGLFGVKLSEGALANMLARAEKPFTAQAAKIAAIVRASDCIASDETSARVCGKTHWQWTFVTKTAVSHVIAPTRGKAVPVAFLGRARPRIWLSDRYGGQGKLGEAHQYCLAHLLRDAQYAIDAGDGVFAPAFKVFLRDACAVGRRRSGLTDMSITEHARRLKAELEHVLALEPAASDGRKLRDSMLVNARDKLLVFLTMRDCEPTNNASERALRPSVIFRKVTNGFRSTWGAKVYADVCSIVATGKLAGHCALAAIRDALSGQPIPA
jgi:transposase